MSVLIDRFGARRTAAVAGIALAGGSAGLAKLAEGLRRVQMIAVAGALFAGASRLVLAARVHPAFAYPGLVLADGHVPRGGRRRRRGLRLGALARAQTARWQPVDAPRREFGRSEVYW